MKMNILKGNIIEKKRNSLIFLILDIVIFTIYKGRLCYLSVEENINGYLSSKLPGGFIDANLSLEENFIKILRNDTGIEDLYHEKIGLSSDLWHENKGNYLSISYIGLIRFDNLLKIADLTRLCISDINEPLNLQTTDISVINTAKEYLVERIEVTDIIKYIMPLKFTYPEIHAVYEELLGEKMDIRNFKRRILCLKSLRSTSEYDRSKSKKPARLYFFD